MQDLTPCLLTPCLTPGGHHYALFMQTGREGGPPFHCELADMRGLFPPSRWTWPDSEPERESHPNGLFELATVLVRRQSQVPPPHS